jgi:hypothetical protein
MNTRNLVNLTRRYFIEGGRKDITTFLMVILIIAILDFIQPLGVSNTFMLLVLNIMAILYAGRIFSIFQPVSKTIHYLTIPASSAEKTLFNACLVYLYYNVLLVAALFLGSVLGELLRKLIISSYEFNLFFPITWNELFTLLTFESVFIFGSIYFKTHPVVKTLLWMLAVSLVLFLVDSSIMNIYNRKAFISASTIDIERIRLYICIVIFVFFNFMTWLRLRETEA